MQEMGDSFASPRKSCGRPMGCIFFIPPAIFIYSPLFRDPGRFVVTLAVQTWKNGNAQTSPLLPTSNPKKNKKEHCQVNLCYLLFFGVFLLFFG